MGMAVCGGASLKCSFGMVPSVFMALPTNKVINNMPLGNIMDNKPMVNVMPFVMCSAPANPAVAAATAAAFGVPAPAPCMPVLNAPWIPGSSSCLIGGYPALNDSCSLMCIYGGVITVASPGQTSIMIP